MSNSKEHGCFSRAIALIGAVGGLGGFVVFMQWLGVSPPNFFPGMRRSEVSPNPKPSPTPTADTPSPTPPHAMAREHYDNGLTKLFSSDYPDGAIRELNESIQIDNNRADAYLYLGLSYMLKNQCQKAVQAFDRATRSTAIYGYSLNTRDTSIDTVHGLAYSLRGFTKLQLQQNKQALVDLQEGERLLFPARNEEEYASVYNEVRRQEIESPSNPGSYSPPYMSQQRNCQPEIFIPWKLL